ncbi:uncharacterized protein [Apostichopus japonicus]|uniref:uncharacterized protein n=1 Tax=Stichopus japonicus TaxID=307972 RepID=UPI003AB549C0
MKPFTIIAAVVCGIYLLLEWTEGKTCYYTTTIDENGAVKWIKDKGDCDVIKFGGVKTTATPKSFTGKGISPTTEDILTSSTAQTSEDMPSTEAVGSTSNPPDKGISPTTENILTSSTAQTSEETSSTEAVGSTNNPPGKGISPTTENILTSSNAQTSEDTSSTEAVGSTNNPPGITTTTEDILASSTAQTSEDIPSTEAVGSTNNPPGTSIPTCPKNMINATCSCQGTCEDPNGQSACNRHCLGSEGCTCPVGFLQQGSDCTNASECVCIVTEANLFITNGEASVNNDCTRKCSCSNNQLTCADYICITNAVCDVRDGVRKCYCNEGYEGDGETCVSLSYKDCQDVYDAGYRQDGVYTIMPTGWHGLPFNVSCKMENGGGWTVLQRRTDGSTSFYQNWTAYKEGFGDSKNLWLGNEKLHYLTNQRNYKLRFDITTSSGSAKYAEYAEFQIESESNNYKMNKLGSHSGYTGYYFNHSRGKQFSTHDRDNDGCGKFNCAEKHISGWWHSNKWCSSCRSNGCCHQFQYSSRCKSTCTAHNLNGVYNGGNGEGIFSSCKTYCNIQYVEMKILPSS